MKYSVETYDEVIEDIKPLLEGHWEEIALYKDEVTFAPNYFMYKELEEKNLLDIFTARTDKGKLIGYCIVFTMPHMHYSTTIMSNVDIFYVAPEYRGKMAGLRLIKLTEQKLKEKGVKVIFHHVKVAHDFSPLLERLGYEKTEHIYGHYIGE